MTKRRRARELALQLLYQNDLAGEDPLETIEQLPRLLTGRQDRAVEEFARSLLQDTLGRRAEIDEELAAVSEHWRLKRMSAVDRNILRLGAAELLFRTDIPPKVSINEAVELAKKYGDMDSARFVNGVLDALLNSHARPPGNG